MAYCSKSLNVLSVFSLSFSLQKDITHTRYLRYIFFKINQFIKNKKFILFFLSISLQILASEQKYCLPEVSTLFALLQEYNAPLTCMYVLQMTDQEITAQELISSLHDNLRDESNKSLLKSCLTIAILQRSMPCVLQKNLPFITCQESKKRKFYTKPPFL